jgi:hypothetical protein
VPHFEEAAAGFADGGKRFREQVVEGFAILQPRTEFGGRLTEFII